MLIILINLLIFDALIELRIISLLIFDAFVEVGKELRRGKTIVSVIIFLFCRIVSKQMNTHEIQW